MATRRIFARSEPQERKSEKSISKKHKPKRTASFYIFLFLLVILVVSAEDKEMESKSTIKDAAESARKAQGLWDTLVPERNWSIKKPQFWVLFAATSALWLYNQKGGNRLERLEKQAAEKEAMFKAKALGNAACKPHEPSGGPISYK